MPEMISKVMRQEHARLASLLSKLMIVLGEKSEDSKKSFIELKWNVEKHFKIEEEAIFEAYGDRIQVDKKEIHLIQEHKLMISMIKEFEIQIEKEEYPDFTEFQTIMLNHQNKEDDYFYNKLEENLNEDQKADVLDKIKEMIKG